MEFQKTPQLWLNFKNAFTKALDEAGKEKLNEAWKDVASKTTFYGNLMPSIANRLGMKHQFERLRRDHTFLKANGVPLIIIECENQHGTAWQEMEFLCSLAAPLKMLVLSCEWQASEKNKFLPIWIEIIRKHHAVVSLDCMYGIIVGEWQESDFSFEYSFTCIDTNGNSREDGFHQVVR
jgi:hypothetical protein